MGTHFFKKPDQVQPSGLNLEARALNAPGYSGARAGGRALKDLGAAQGVTHANALPLKKSAASDAPGPKV